MYNIHELNLSKSQFIIFKDIDKLIVFIFVYKNS